MHTAGSHLHAREVGTEQARIREMSRRPRGVTNAAFEVAKTAAAGRATTVTDAATRLGITEKTIKALVRAGRMEGTRDENGRVTGVVESSIGAYRKSRAAGRRKFAACQFKTAASYAAAA